MGGECLFYGHSGKIEGVHDFLRAYLSAKERWMIANSSHLISRRFVDANLSLEKRAVITTGAQDEVIFAVIEMMVEEERERQRLEATEGRHLMSRFSLFDCLFPNSRQNHAEYIDMNLRWLLVEKGLAHTDDSAKLNEDSNKNLNGCRARVYFSIKYPDKVDLLHNTRAGCGRRIPCAAKSPCLLCVGYENADFSNDYFDPENDDSKNAGSVACRSNRSARMKKAC